MQTGGRIRTLVPVTGEMAVILARNIRVQRGRRQWKKEELAERLGWSATVMSQVESGSRRVVMEDLPSLCRVFGITLVELMEGADPADLAVLGLTPDPLTP
jgi:transcriptional regulator with XRE-family HTH domain